MKIAIESADEMNLDLPGLKLAKSRIWKLKCEGYEKIMALKPYWNIMMLNKARQILQKFYGYEDFRPGQKKVVESLLNRNDSCKISLQAPYKSLHYYLKG